MIRALEEQVAAWVQQVAGESSALFGSPTVVTGTLDPGALPEGQAAILVAVSRLVPAPEHRDLGPAPVNQDDRTRLRAELTVALVGPAEAADPGGLTLSPPGASVHQVDMLALTLLARLRERSRPGADGAADWHGGSRGRVAVKAGDREAELKWAAVEAGDPVAVEEEGTQRRQWRMPLHATVEYRLSTLPLDGGRIKAIGIYQDFVPAERLPLSYFAGVDGALQQKLGAAGISRLGDLRGKNAAVLATQINLAEPYAVRVLTDLVTVANTRLSYLAPVPFSDTLAEAMWLPARAFIDPTAGEQAILNRARAKPMEAIALAVLGLGTAVVLRPDLLETVLVGRLLAREGTP
jgi:hypothetical protein